MNWETTANKWFAFEQLDAKLKEKLNALIEDPKALEDLFYKHLEFGTGGMRGELGPGTNRLNIYVFDNLILSHF